MRTQSAYSHPLDTSLDPNEHSDLAFTSTIPDGIDAALQQLDQERSVLGARQIHKILIKEVL